MDMITGGFDARALRARSAPVSFAPARRVPRWADWRWLAGGATALMLTAFAFVPMPETPAEAAAAGIDVPVMAAAGGEPSFAELAHIAFDLRVEEGRSFAATLERAGVRRREAKEVSRMVAHALDMDPEVGTRAEVRLGGVTASGTRPLTELSLVSRGWRVAVTAKERGDGFLVSRQMLPPPVEGTIRLSGVAGDGLYWALREAGVGPSASRDYLMALNTRMDVGTLDARDRFDLVLEPAGDRAMIVYAGLKRGDGTEFQLVRLGLGKRSRWIDSEGRDGREARLGWPSNAAVSSNYGMRFHPILRVNRMHSGIDFSAPAGSPIYATADGVVNSAGWAGGHGQRVMLAHEGGLKTSYSHMSRIAVSPGIPVKRGDVIGYVGSTGLSTGAHLHYEVHLGGRAVNPSEVGGVRARPIGGETLEKVRARLASYLQLEQQKST